MTTQKPAEEKAESKLAYDERKVRLTLPWTDADGKEHKQGDVLVLKRAVANTLVHGGRAVRVEDKKGGSAS